MSLVILLLCTAVHGLPQYSSYGDSNNLISDYIPPDAQGGANIAQTTFVNAPTSDYIAPDAQGGANIAQTTVVNAPTSDYIAPDAQGGANIAQTTFVNAPTSDYIAPDAQGGANIAQTTFGYTPTSDYVPPSSQGETIIGPDSSGVLNAVGVQPIDRLQISSQTPLQTGGSTQFTNNQNLPPRYTQPQGDRSVQKVNISPSGSNSGPLGEFVGTCASSLVCVPRAMCNPYTGFLQGGLLFEPDAATSRQPTVALLQCYRLKDGGVGDGVCCQMPHINDPWTDRPPTVSGSALAPNGIALGSGQAASLAAVPQKQYTYGSL